MRHDSQYPLRQAHYVSHSTDFANRAIEKGDLYRALGRYNGSLGQPQYPNLVRGAWDRHWTYTANRVASR